MACHRKRRWYDKNLGPPVSPHAFDFQDLITPPTFQEWTATSKVRQFIARSECLRSRSPPPFLTFSIYLGNDVCVHPNQGELISCDQAGSIKQWDLSENLCSHELASITIVHTMFHPFTHTSAPRKTPAGDVPIRSISLALDGSCLVAGNNKVRSPPIMHICWTL